MGNALAKKFDVGKDYVATAGHCSLFKIWNGKKKETFQDVSIWAFDKNELSKRKVNPITDKAISEQVHQLMKRDLHALKDCDCQSIIQIIEIVEDSKNAIAFTTEKIVCSLADVLNRFEGVPSTDASFFDNGESLLSA